MGAWRATTWPHSAQGQISCFEAYEDFDTKRFSNPLQFYFNRGLTLEKAFRVWVQDLHESSPKSHSERLWSWVFC